MLPIALGGLHDRFGGYGAGPDARRRSSSLVAFVGVGVLRAGLASRLGRHRRSARVMVKTGCPYCGVGCGLVAEVATGGCMPCAAMRSTRSTAARRAASRWRCPRPSRAADRALTPLLRGVARTSASATRRGTTALGDVAARLQAIRAEHGPDAIAFYISGQLLTEDYYAVNKLAKGFLGTNNVDSNSRLCMSSRGRRLRRAFGSDGPPPAYADLELADCILLLGSNAAACHPILWGRIRAAQERGRDADRRRPAPHRHRRRRRPAPAVRPGTDLALLNAMLHARGATTARRGARGDARDGRADWTLRRAAARAAIASTSPPRGVRRRRRARWRCGRWAPTSRVGASRRTAR